MLTVGFCVFFLVAVAGLENAAAMLTKGQRTETDDVFLSFRRPMRRVA